MVSTFYPSGHSGTDAPGNPASPGRPERLTRQQQNDLIAWVQVWHDAGCAVHPAKTDGSKYAVAVKGGSPDLIPPTFPDVYPSGKFKGMPHPQAGQPNPDAGQHGWGWGRIATGDMPRLTVDQAAAIIRAGRADGIGIICGLASGGVFMLEAEGRARDLLPKVREAAERLGCLPLLERLAAGCVDESPSGGVHFYARSSDGIGPGNTVLAARPDDQAEHGRQILFETRGQGGWSVVAPSSGRTHKSGKPYRFLRGGPSTIPTFSQADIDLLFQVFRAVDEMPAPAVPEVQPAAVQRRPRPDGDILPGDDFNQRATWDEILTGWKRSHVVGDRQHWTRPGKEHGTSATTTADVLCCFSSSVGLPVTDRKNSGNGLSKFAAYAHLNHGGDFAAAARELWYQGYGSRAADDQDDGGQPVTVEPRPTPQGPTRDLAGWRDEVLKSRVAAVTTPGLMSLDRSPTGSGKSFATNEALARASSSLTVLPTHANVIERVQEMRNHGIDAVAFPELTADNCQHFDKVRHAQRLGLVAGAAVCPGCPLNRVPNPRYPGNGKEPKTIPGPCHAADQYQGLMQAARDAQHRVGTHERLRRSSKCAEGVQVVVIDEAPETVLAPTLHISVSQVTPVETLAHAIRHHWYSEATADQKSFAGALLDVVAAIHAACADITTAGVRRVDLVLGHQVPRNWQRLLFDSIRQVGVADSLEADALVLITKAAAGELSSLEIVTDLTAKGRLMHFVVGGWRPTLPTDAAVVCLDATGDAADIAAVVGRQVVDCTPSGHLPLAQPVVQIADDISRKMSSSTVAGLVEAFLTAHPEVQRLGIIGHRRHIHDLIDGGLLSGPARDRVAKWCYFGQGPDRGSNDWHQTPDGSPACDHLLRLGTPRANPGDYRRWLVQHGLHGAAGKVDGDWGRRDWEAVTVDGRTFTVPGVGYADPDWHRAYTAISRAAGRQADGRGRAILPDGIPVTILSNEPGPYPIAPSLVTTPKAVRETVEIVRTLACQQPLPLVPPTAKNPIGIPYRENCTSQPVPAADCLAAIMAAADIDRRAAHARLSACRKAGLLAQPKRGWYALPDSPGATATDLPAPVARPEPQPTPPAVVQPPVQAVVIAAVGPVIESQPVDVVADSAPGTTTATCTSTVQSSPPGSFDDLMGLVEERAAILEFDGGHDRETADRMAREMVLGRDTPTPPVDPPDDIVVAVDHAGLAARATPYVHQTLDRFTGTVRVIGDRDDPFAGRRGRLAARRPGQCQCGHDDAWKRVPIHGGQSVRIDCGHCDRFGWFAVWHGQRLPGPAIDDPPPRVPAKTPGPHRLSFVPVPPAAPVGMVLAPAC